MKVKVPQKFKIGATPVSICFAENLVNDDGFDGTFNRRTGKLEIDDRLKDTPAKRDKIFGHELMEVIKENYNLHTSEEDMSNIANGWLEFLSQLGIEFDWEEIK